MQGMLVWAVVASGLRALRCEAMRLCCFVVAIWRHPPLFTGCVARLVCMKALFVVVIFQACIIMLDIQCILDGLHGCGSGLKAMHYAVEWARPGVAEA